MASFFQRIIQIRSRIENSKIWESATKTAARVVVSGLFAFAAAMAMLVSTPFLYFYTPLLGIAAFAAFVVLMMFVNLLSAEGRRRENGK